MSATILPCSTHCATPQLMNTIFLPAGTGLPIGSVTLIAVGRFEARATICSAWRSFALDFSVAVPAPPAELLVWPDEPHPATSAAPAMAATAATRRTAGLERGIGSPR